MSDKLIRYGLGAVKGTGEQAIAAIVAAREADGPFKSLFDFCARVDRQRVNKRTVEALVRAGAFDSLAPEHASNRAQLAAAIDLAFEFAAASEANANQGGLFDLLEDAHGASTQEPELPAVAPWGVKERLAFEKTAIGFYLSGHLFDEAEHEVRQFARRRIADLQDSREPQLAAGIVTGLRFINGQRGKLALFKLDDKTAAIEARADEGVYAQWSGQIKDDELLVVMGKVMPDRFSGGQQMTITQIWDLPAARCRFGKYLRVAVGRQPPDVRRLLEQYPPRLETTEYGDLARGLPVRLALERRGAHPSPHTGAAEGDNAIAGVAAQLDLGDEAKFFPSDAALAGWIAQADEGRAMIVYE